MNSKATPANIASLFASGMSEGSLDADALTGIKIENLGAQIAKGFGVDIDTVTASEVVIFAMMPDDSGSIDASNNSQTVRDGHNLVIEALKGAGKSSRDGILATCQYLNGYVLYPIVPLDDAVLMDSMNYDPQLGTPLYDQTAVLLATMLAKYQEFRDAGVPCRTVSLIITDGEDMHSRKQTSSSIKKLVNSMLKGEDHIVAAMGIGNEANFRRIFTEMGILDKWILTPGTDKTEIRKAFKTFSQSAVRASQCAAGGFSQMGGFGS